MGYLVGLGVAIATAGAASGAAAQATPPYLAAFPDFNPALTSPFPGDVDTTLMKQLVDQKKFAEVQRLFDLDAWQMFLAVNWPTNDQGQPAPAITDTGFGAPHWTLWQTSPEIYRTDGKRPLACPRPAAAEELAAVAQGPAPLLKGLPLIERPPGVGRRAELLLADISAVGNISVIDLKKGGEIDQAFAGPLIDQNGNFVHYDIALDPNEVGYICQTGIYDINGQVAFSKGKSSATLDFPVGVDKQDWSGATEVKFAWKILAKDDQPARFFSTKAIVPTATGGTQEVTVGLVGMHIAHKSVSSPQWIWATFEQVDNLVGDPLAHPAIKPSFYNPDCPICAPNLDPKTTGDFASATQAMRAIPIPGDKLLLNAQAQAALAKIGSVWRYYELIDTQWPTAPTAKPTPWNAGLPNAVTNKPGGNPTPVFLTNITMETYFQRGVQSACGQEETPGALACPPTSPPTFGTPSADGTQIFASESCMGCHSSAGFYRAYDASTQKGVYWPQLGGDFSWLPQLKASYLSGN